MDNKNTQADKLQYLVEKLKTNSTQSSLTKDVLQTDILLNERKNILKEIEDLVGYINKNIGIRIMQARNNNNPVMKLRELSEKCGVISRENLSRVEKNIHKIPAAKLAVIASVQQKPISYYFDGFLYSNNSKLSPENHDLCLNLIDYFLGIRIPELQVILFDFIKQLSQAESLGNEEKKLKNSEK
jgi:hypothetical protein